MTCTPTVKDVLGYCLQVWSFGRSCIWLLFTGEVIWSRLSLAIVYRYGRLIEVVLATASRLYPSCRGLSWASDYQCWCLVEIVVGCCVRCMVDRSMKSWITVNGLWLNGRGCSELLNTNCEHIVETFLGCSKLDIFLVCCSKLT